jgi:hypothetical protein
METIPQRSAEEATKPPKAGEMRFMVSILCALPMVAQPGGPAPDLRGVYQSIPDRMTLLGGLKNAGAPAGIELLPETARQTRNVDLKRDPWKMCQPVGPF